MIFEFRSKSPGDAGWPLRPAGEGQAGERRGAARPQAAIAAVLATIVVVAAGCDAVGRTFRTQQPPQQPQACAQVFSPARCLVMTDTAASQLRTTRENITSLVVIPDPTPEVRPNGDVILQTVGGARRINLEVTFADGTMHRVGMCGGVSRDPACVNDPHIETGDLIHGGYQDVQEGSSPVPSAAPDALAEATELRLDRMDIAIDQVGKYEVRLGEARLPNGLLTQADFALVDDWPRDLTILDGVRTEVRSLDDGKPLMNVYEHGWRNGVEPVEAFLVFEVFRFEPGAKLTIRDVVVR